MALLVGLFAASYSARPALADQIWLQAYNGFAGDNRAYAVALDSSGNAVVTGGSPNANGVVDGYTAKYAAADGRLLWSVRHDSPYGGDSLGTGVAIDASGNVIVTGYSGNGAPNGGTGGSSPFNFYTAKYAGTDGTLIWEHWGPLCPCSTGCATPMEEIKWIAVDSQGNVVVTGNSNQQGPRGFYTAKYAVADGHTLWEQYDLAPGGSWPTGLALDGGGNAIVTGVSYATGFPNYSTIETIKYAGGNGQVVWRRIFDSGTGGDNYALGVAVDQNGNVLLSGMTVNSCCVAVQSDYYAAKYAATDGGILWQQIEVASIDSAFSRDEPLLQDITVDSAGNAIVNQPNSLAKFAGSDGHLIWRQNFELGNCALVGPAALAVDGADNVIVTGGTGGFLTSKYAAADGSLLWQQVFPGNYFGGFFPHPFSSFSHGVAVDSSGNIVVVADNPSSSSTFDFTTVKYIPSGTPSTIITCPGNIVKGTDPGLCSAVVSYATPSATDACGNSIPVTGSPASGSAFPVGTTVVTCTARDGTSCNFTVTVNDTQAPSISCPANISIGCSVNALAPATFAATATDNCDPNPTITYSIQPGSGFPVGTTPVTCTATDSSGNQSSCTFNVTRAPLGFTGFLSPVGGADATGGSFSSPVRTFKLNSTIPVKFTSDCAGSPVLSGVHRLEVIQYTSQTNADPPIDATPTDAATTGDEFQLNGSQWQFNLDTKATGMTPGIWLLQATLSDGSQHTAWIQIK